jgi:hypothetical protein
MYFDIIIKNYSIQTKFKIYIRVLENGFLTDVHKNEFTNMFCKIQKTYFGFKKLYFKWLQTKGPVVLIDLNLNDITVSQKNVILLTHHHTNYLFNIVDLIKLIEHSLTKSSHMFSEPAAIKNPYDNSKFSKTTLYNIYFFIKFNTDIHSELFHNFFLVAFELDVFKKKYEYTLREHIIRNYAHRSSEEILLKEITNMISEFNKTWRTADASLSINADFPRKKLIQIFRPYFYIYLQSKHSLIPSARTYYYSHFLHYMIQFYNYNKMFGRKQIKIISGYDPIKKKNIKQQIITFNDKCIRFNSNNPKTSSIINLPYPYQITSPEVTHFTTTPTSSPPRDTYDDTYDDISYDNTFDYVYTYANSFRDDDD